MENMQSRFIAPLLEVEWNEMVGDWKNHQHQHTACDYGFDGRWFISRLSSNRCSVYFWSNNRAHGFTTSVLAIVVQEGDGDDDRRNRFGGWWRRNVQRNIHQVVVDAKCAAL